MSLAWLQASRFRNLRHVTLELSTGVNLIHGENGSGKTSLLESCYFLSVARSFRSSSLDLVIQRGEEDCLVTGRILHGDQEYQAGVSRNRSGAREIKVGGERVHRAAELVRLLPTLVLGPESVGLLTGAPSLRRRFLNWGLFHMEPGFASLWEEANRCLRQRNRLLRDDSAGNAELESWSTQLAKQAERLDDVRRKFVAGYLPVFQSVVARLTGIEGITFEYFRGWGKDRNLAHIYEAEVDGDKKKGFTQKGFQRADVRISLDGQPAAKVCSGGELKALVWGMILAQGSMMQDGDILYLVDDIASEFDLEHRRRVCRYLMETNAQMILTGVDREALMAACDGVFDAMFHVKHGDLEVQES